jgi:hypothetical protein
VGPPTITEAGTVKLTRRVVPVTVVTAVAVVVVTAEGPVRVTVTLAGNIVPDGKFEPNTATLVTPGSAVAGLAAPMSVTWIGF